MNDDRAETQVFEISNGVADANLKAQPDAWRFGMWLFLVMEMLFFGAFFMLFFFYFRIHEADFKIASHHLNRWIAFSNTAILLTSSFCMAIAVEVGRSQCAKPHAMDEPTVKSPRAPMQPAMSQLSNAKRARAWLLATSGLGLLFLGLKVFEYHLDAVDGLLPYFHFAPHFQASSALQLFFSLYFFVTLIHFVHLTIGCTWLAVLAFSDNCNFEDELQIAGLYWHFVDVIWILLLPTLYLLQ